MTALKKIVAKQNMYKSATEESLLNADHLSNDDFGYLQAIIDYNLSPENLSRPGDMWRAEPQEKVAFYSAANQELKELRLVSNESNFNEYYESPRL